ncbi:MAG: methyltransferase domain-containing protein [bacterium]|jgi:DNA modification methylase
MSESLARRVIEDKEKGLTDEEIGAKHKVTLKFIEKVTVGKYGVNISDVKRPIKVSRLFAPIDDKLQTTTVWSFKSRGSWATHNGNYRGNWSPYIPRNVIKRYSKEGDLVLDYFCGAGTTGVECKLLGRNFIGIDINPAAIKLAKQNVDFNIGTIFRPADANVIDFRVGDARNLAGIADDSIDLICAHPPYSDILHYTENNPADLSHLAVQDFLREMDKVAAESIRVLKDGKYCAILIGDMRKNKRVVPLGFWTIERFLNAGFRLKELIIKRQHNCKTTGFWYNNSIKFNFLLLAHEYLAIFQKDSGEAVIKPREKKFDLNFSVVKPELESTTVWIFSPDNWLTKTISNLVHRYNGKKYAIFEFENAEGPDLDLAIIKYNKDIKKSLRLAEKDLKPGATLAIICEDVRTKTGTIYSQSIELEKLLRESARFKIQEIVIVSRERADLVESESCLSIIHNGVLVYSKC